MIWPFKRKKTTPQIPKHATILSIPGEKVRTTLVEARYFKATDFNNLVDALCAVHFVLNSTEFPARVLQIPSFTYTSDTPLQVLAKIYDADELGTGVDHEIQFDLEAYHGSWWSRVIGYTYPSALRIWTNLRFFSFMTQDQRAGHLCHEFLHKISYDHASAKDLTSVPYRLGYLVEELAFKYEAEIADLRSQVEIFVR